MIQLAQNGSSSCTVSGTDGFVAPADGLASVTDTPLSTGTFSYTMTCLNPTTTTTTPAVVVTVNP